MTSILLNQSRRTFLRRTSQMALAGVAAAPLLSSLDLIRTASAATSTDYKALVCVFLHGGNDYANTIVPYDADNHTLYAMLRNKIAIGRSDLGATVLSPANDLEGRQYALNPALSSLAPQFAAGKMAVLLNVGTLIEPTTRTQYFNQTVQLPPKLFSHNSQQAYVATSNSDAGASGWGGRIGDFVQAYNSNPQLTCISAGQQSVFLSGDTVNPYCIGKTGAVDLLGGSSLLLGSADLHEALLQSMTAGDTNIFGGDYAALTSRSQDMAGTVNAALDSVPASQFPMFSASNAFIDQLRIIARMIAVSSELGAKRQVFFVGLGGWDMHSGLLARHEAMLGTLGGGLSAFQDALEQLGVAQQVTTFTASDFGRTLASNGDGSDHGWGGHQLIMGGAVNGGRIYGTPPKVGINTSDDVGSGRLIPTTSVDQYAATLARWFGVSDSDLPLLLPNLANFDRSTWNLGIV
ncbi:DUF1501 domain-containing protein [Novosphingobium profundi]|uniref:DUF1501 domain-containing protein n=1 Tax=Novosphingobium profundi TaxID=1774954 RepID=UPI001BD948A7|nr:DUF1501 domain-containing protein [Novosphingobium profundi]MBT0668294.1 DUF1501 domain-containing protein [Novosphingobium profundi]